MKIEKITVKNFKGLTELEQNINGKHVYVKGPNGAGKTSFLEAIFKVLSGKDFAKELVTKGAKKGLVEIDLGDYIARLKTTSGRTPTFEIEAKQGDGDRMIKAPRSWLNEAIGLIDFDIMAFLSTSGKEQVEYLCKAMGIDFTEVNDELVEALDQRRLANKELGQLKGAVEYYDKALAALAEIDIADLSKRIADAAQRHRERSGVQKGCEDRATKIKANVERIDALRREIEALEQSTATLTGEINDGVAWLDDPDNDSVPDIEYDAMKIELNTANEKNKAIAEARRFAELESKIKEAEKVVTDLDDFVGKKRGEKSKLLADNLDVADLSYDTENEMFLWKGLPFASNQINTADQIIAGLKIGSTFLKDLRILRFDGSLIDNNNFAAILEFANTNDIELFVEIVDREGQKLEIIAE